MLLNIVTNFDGKTWAGIILGAFLLIVFFKGLGTKEGGCGDGNGNGNSNNRNNRNNGMNNTSTMNNTSNMNNNNNGLN